MIVGNDRGAAATEFALVAPTFIMMIFLMLDGGRMIFAKQAVNELAVATARCAALQSAGCSTIPEVKSWAVARGQGRSMLSISAANVAVNMSTTCNGQVSMAQATITMPFKKGVMNLLPQSVAPSNLTATSCFPVAPTT